MGKALIVMCCLGVVLAAWTTIQDSGLGIRDSGSGTREVPGSGFGSRSPTRTELDATIASNRQRVAANPGDGEAAVELADALMGAARVSADASLAIEAGHVLRATLRHSPSDYMSRGFAEALTEAKAAQEASAPRCLELRDRG